MPSPPRYKVDVADAGASAAVIAGIGRCQDELCCHHWQLYLATHPELAYGDWERMLCLGRVREFIDHGVGVLYAKTQTGEVVGYLSFSRLDADQASSGQGACAFLKVNHLVVLEQHRRAGVGRLLMTEFLGKIGVRIDSGAGEGPVTDPEADVGVQIVAAELNEEAISWYRGMGFRAMNLHTKECGDRKICYVDLRRCWGSVKVSGGTELIPSFCRHRANMFGEELCGEFVQPLGSDGQQTARPPFRRVVGYDAQRGLHQLDGPEGELADLSAEFASGGGLRFGRPLHVILTVPKPPPPEGPPRAAPAGKAFSWRAGGLRRARARARGPRAAGGAQRRRERGSSRGAAGGRGSGRRERRPRSGAPLGDRSRLRSRSRDGPGAGGPASRSDDSDSSDAGSDSPPAGGAPEFDIRLRLRRRRDAAAPDKAGEKSQAELWRHAQQQSVELEEALAARRGGRRRRRRRRASPASGPGRPRGSPRADAPDSDTSPDVWEDWPCRVCGKNSDDSAMILCDGKGGTCNATYHYYCIGESRVPRGKWFCPPCVAAGTLDCGAAPAAPQASPTEPHAAPLAAELPAPLPPARPPAAATPQVAVPLATSPPAAPPPALAPWLVEQLAAAAPPAAPPPLAAAPLATPGAGLAALAPDRLASPAASREGRACVAAATDRAGSLRGKAGGDVAQKEPRPPTPRATARTAAQKALAVGKASPVCPRRRDRLALVGVSRGPTSRTYRGLGLQFVDDDPGGFPCPPSPSTGTRDMVISSATVSAVSSASASGEPEAAEARMRLLPLTAAAADDDSLVSVSSSGAERPGSASSKQRGAVPAAGASRGGAEADGWLCRVCAATTESWRDLCASCGTPRSLAAAEDCQAVRSTARGDLVAASATTSVASSRTVGEVKRLKIRCSHSARGQDPRADAQGADILRGKGLEGV